MSQRDSAVAKWFRSLLNHPTGFWFIFWGEFAERSSYYGMRAILALYMEKKLGFSEGDASRNMAFFIAACYFLPLVGGYIADQLIGKFWTIVGFSLPYILGHVILGIENRTCLVIALALLAMGAGVIKPNISTLMGMTYDQKRPGQEQLRSEAFAMFYFAINLGAAISAVAMPIIRTQWGYAVAFLFPAGLMVLAFLLFAAGKRHYAVEVIRRTRATPEQRQQQWQVLSRLYGIFLIVAFFWSIFDQSASTWTFFADDYMDLNVFGVTLEPDMVQATNPFLILVLLPPITVLWRVLDQRGLRVRTTDKMMVGFILAAACMGVMTLAGYMSTPEHKVSVLWEVAAYVIITIAEVCISVVGLELAFTAAPKSMKSFVTACWLLCVFGGNMVNSLIAPLYGDGIKEGPFGLTTLTPGAYFCLMTLMMVPVTLAFVFVARQFNRAAATWHTDIVAEAAPQVQPAPSSG